MQRNISQIKVAGVWRNMLIISSDTPIDTSPTEWEFPLDETTSIKYFTHGLQRVIQQNGKWYYWFLYDESRVIGGVEELEALRETNSDLQQANDILMGVSD